MAKVVCRSSECVVQPPQPPYTKLRLLQCAWQLRPSAYPAGVQEAPFLATLTPQYAKLPALVPQPPFALGRCSMKAGWVLCITASAQAMPFLWPASVDREVILGGGGGAVFFSR